MRRYAFALIALLPVAASSQAPAADSSAPAQEAVLTERLVEPRVKHIDTSHYPVLEQRNDREGWVVLGFMVDPVGKPFEVTVTASSGNPTFESAAVRAMEESTFEPGTLNGRPIESASRLKMTFSLVGPQTGANPEFVTAYRTFYGALKSGNRPAAQNALRELQVQNLYEDAFFGLATFLYANRWGDESQQLAGLSRAIAGEHYSHYLPKSEFNAALLEYMKLQLKRSEYAEALSTWHDLQKSGLDARTKAQGEPLIDELKNLQANDAAYDVEANLRGGNWGLDLFKRHFRARVTQGRLDSVKLRCSKAFVRFAFNPDLQYTVQDKYGQCEIELEGEPGTRAVLTQF